MTNPYADLPPVSANAAVTPTVSTKRKSGALAPKSERSDSDDVIVNKEEAAAAAAPAAADAIQKKRRTESDSHNADAEHDDGAQANTRLSKHQLAEEMLQKLASYLRNPARRAKALDAAIKFVSRPDAITPELRDNVFEMVSDQNRH
jgi:hypothetical protein